MYEKGIRGGMCHVKQRTDMLKQTINTLLELNIIELS